MKIISNFSDYYDSGLAFESGDNQVIYLRDEKVFKVSRREKYPPLVKSTLDIFYNNLDHVSLWEWRFKQSTQWGRFEINNGKNVFYHNLLKIIFCGKIYPLIRIQINNATSDINYFYDFDSYQNFLQKHKIEFSNTKGRNIAENFFKLSITPNQYTFLIENKITNAIIENDSIIFNGKLADYSFYKVFDPYTAYQELDTWLSGVLSYPQNIMIEVGNESKIEKHGFDKKYGFRTRPKK